jgi:hypothetical protein
MLPRFSRLAREMHRPGKSGVATHWLGAVNFRAKCATAEDLQVLRNVQLLQRMPADPNTVQPRYYGRWWTGYRGHQHFRLIDSTVVLRSLQLWHRASALATAEWLTQGDDEWSAHGEGTHGRGYY